MLHLANIRFCIIVTNHFARTPIDTFLKIEFTQEVKRKMTLFNVLTVIIYQAETLISVGIVLHFMNARGYVMNSVSILK